MHTTLPDFLQYSLPYTEIRALPSGSFRAQSTKNCKDPPQILMKLGVFGVPMVLITHTDF